jgi:hypothetical protein
MFISLDLMLLFNMVESPVNLLSGTSLGGRKSCIEFKQESIAQLYLGIELCSLVVCVNILDRLLIDSNPCDYLYLLCLLGMVLVRTTQSVPFEIPHRVYVQ